MDLCTHKGCQNKLLGAIAKTDYIGDFVTSPAETLPTLMKQLGSFSHARDYKSLCNSYYLNTVANTDIISRAPCESIPERKAL